MGISRLATPYQFENFGAVRWNSRGGVPITTVVVHHAATTNYDALPGVWKNREASAHYGIGPNGEIRAYIDEDKRAWHCSDWNSRSIGIECTNVSGDPAWGVSDKTVDSLVALIKDIQSRYGKVLIVGHKDVPGSATACCGPSLYPRLPGVRERVNNGNISAVPSEPQTSVPVVKVWNIRQSVDVDGLQVRAAQTTSAKVIRTLSKGQTFNATRRTDNGQNVGGYTSWFEVDGVGWVSGAYVTPIDNKTTVHLPASAPTWRAYPLGAAPVAGNEVGFLAPAQYNGITYTVVGTPQADVVTIDTGVFGRVNIYVGPGTGAIIK